MAKGIRTIWIDSDSVGVLGTKVYRGDVLIATVPIGTQFYNDPTAIVGVEYKYEVQAYTSESESTDETLGVNMDYYTIEGSVPVDLKPIMNNFRVDDATPTHVHFDTPLGQISSLSTTDFTISGRTILAVDTTLNYFTVDTAFNYWDNNTIRKEGGNNDVVYDFTLERITNNIPVPTIAPANYRYVAEDGSDSADGETEGTAWLTLKHALQNTPSGGGYQIWVKVGTYLGENIVQADMDNGAEGAPYRITGYKSTIGDITSNYYTLTPNTAYPALDSTEMPLFDGGDSSTGRFIYNDSRNYYIWENLQVTGYAEAFRSRFSNVQGQQVINSNVKDMGVIGSNYGYGIYWVNDTNTANRNRAVDTNIMNAESNAIVFDGEFNLAKGCKVYSQNGTDGSDGTDYYYLMESSNNIIKDCLAYNDGNGGHNGHGFSCKTSGSGVDEEVHYNLIDGCEAVAIQGAFQARHANCKFNVWKNSIARADIPNRKEGSSDNYTGCIDFQSGGDQNVFENLTCHDTHQFIRFNLNGESDTDPDIQTNALIKNCLVYDVKNVIDANSVIAVVSAPSGNKLANCTIIGADNMFWQWAGTGSVEFGLNKIENCIIEGVEVLNKDEVVVGWTYSYDFSWDIWLANGTPITGTDNESMDTLLDANYQPQATFTDIDVPKINNVFYGKNGNERQDQTTVGSVLSVEEVPNGLVDNYIVASNRSTVGGTGTIEDPYDIQTGCDSLVNGQTLYLRGGTYALTGNAPSLYVGSRFDTPATETNFRTVKNYPNETPVLDGNNLFWVNNTSNGRGEWVEGIITVSNVQQSYSVIDGISFINVLSEDPGNVILWNKCGINTAQSASNVTIKNCYTYNTASSGIYVQGDGHIVDNNEVELFTTAGMQEGITAFNSTNATISNNYVHDIGNYNSHNNGIAIDVKSGSSGAKVFGNRVHNAKIVGIYVDTRGESSDIEIYDNEVYNVDGNDWSTNHGIVIADESPDGVSVSSNIKVFNNLVYKIGSSGIAIGWTAHDGEWFEDCQFVNNTIYNTINGIALYITSIDGGTTPNPSSGIQISNNIMYNQSNLSISESGVVNYASYIVDTNVMDSSPVGLTVVNQLDIDPQFTDALNADFTLQAGSGAINTGKTDVTIYEPPFDYDGNPRVVGGLIDLGAYETQ